MRYNFNTEVLTIGTFDIPHAGHAIFLRKCEEFGTVYVGVNTDEFVTTYKGRPPTFSLQERSRLISELGYNVVPNRESGKELIGMMRPKFLVIGNDWLYKDYLGQIGMTADQFRATRASLIYVPYTDGMSTTQIRERITRGD